jgi:hypothetical protein
VSYNAEAQRRYRQSEEGLLTSRARDRARADKRLEHKRAYAARWRERNPEYQSIRYQSDDNARIADNLRSSLQTTLARLVHRKRLPHRWRTDSRIGRLIGCNPIDFLAHIEAQFLPGMSWANRGLVWQIDHIKPCCAFDLTDPAQQAACFNYTNLRPLSETDNRRRPRKES